MKKSIISIVFATVIILACSVFASAAEITLCSPSEAEIMPTRDFYVVGTINREGDSAKKEPLNIKIELANEKGEIVRSIISNVSIDGLTSAEYFLTDYEYGASTNNAKESQINKFTPPDIVFDGVDRDSIRLAYNKIIVKDNYFVAVIYGGASKEFELKYEDKHGTALSDISEGEYTLTVTALNLEGEEVCRSQQLITFNSSLDRLIASNNLKNYASDNSMVIANSLAGIWNPSDFIADAGDFYYLIPRRMLYNLTTEYSNSNKVHILLNELDLSDLKTNLMFGSVYSKDSLATPSYLYYDIGKSNVDFTFAGSKLEKNGEVVQAGMNNFLKINRVEKVSDANSYVDFIVDDGVIISGGCSNVFYGTYSPVISSATLSGNTYKITNGVNQIKAVILDENNESVYEEVCVAGLLVEDETFNSKYEFKMDITPNEKMLNSEKLTLTFYALDKNSDEIFKSTDINVKVLHEGNFITNYEDNYWGKSFCDGINLFGESPSGVALNPDDHITRGDFAAMVNRLMGYSIVGTSKFSDLNESSIFYDDCVTAYQAGYMTGDENGAINADDLISREQAMIILARISSAKKGDNIVEFKDSGLISFWAKDYVDAMCSTGIVSGFDGYINPQNNITVAEAAALIIKTVRWMYSDDEVLPVGDGNNFVASDASLDLSLISVVKTGIMTEPTKENISEFFNQNSNVFAAVTDYIVKNCPNGAYVGKVGNGLELRDYKWGSALTFSTDAVNVITDMSSCFSSFAVKYNPNNSDNLYFSFGKNANGKEVGIAYVLSEETNGKILSKIADNWYYFAGE